MTTPLITVTYTIKMTRGVLAGMTIPNRTVRYPTPEGAAEWLRVVTAKGLAGELDYTIESSTLSAG